MMEYKGYFAKIEFDDEDNVFHGEVANLKDVITFEGESVGELRQAFKDSVDDYLEFCADRGEEPDKPYSGKFVVRTNAELHRAAVRAAMQNNVSLNTWLNDLMQRELGKSAELK